MYFSVASVDTGSVWLGLSPVFTSDGQNLTKKLLTKSLITF